MIDVVMPQMGESIAEGTVTRWLKTLGDRVERDEPLLEISTDKVDAEIPAPASGVLHEILVHEGTTVPVQTVLARIDSAETAVASPGPAAAATEPPAPSPSVEPAPAVAEAPESPTAEELRRTRSSPLVRRIAAEHGVEIEAVQGTGLSGRVTKQDILDHIAKAEAAAPAPTPPPLDLRMPLRRMEPLSIFSAPPPAPPLEDLAPASPAAVSPASRPENLPGPMTKPSGRLPEHAPAQPVPTAAIPAPSAPGPAPASAAAPTRDQVVPMSPIRKKTAEHMLASRRISAHATTLFEIDMTRVDQLRAAHKRAYHERGVPLTYLPFILKATVDSLKAYPLLNASVDGDQIIYHRDINLGVAVALDHGLIVPIIRNADEKNVLGLARAIADLAERARTKRLKVEEVQGGTFTLTNPGVFGSLFGAPIIHQPQVAILAVGVIEKRPVVREDAIAIRSMAYFALSFDHRIVDGADADRFMAHLKRGLTEFDESAL
jgi:pyruvate/2-oxoglutarate dehydrogenase complex dihydrolipoamide acyltransferase (E2) component